MKLKIHCFFLGSPIPYTPGNHLNQTAPLPLSGRLCTTGCQIIGHGGSSGHERLHGAGDQKGGGRRALQQTQEETERREALAGALVHGEHDEGLVLEHAEDLADQVVGQDTQHVVHDFHEAGGDLLEVALVLGRLQAVEVDGRALLVAAVACRAALWLQMDICIKKTERKKQSQIRVEILQKHVCESTKTNSRG